MRLIPQQLGHWVRSGATPWVALALSASAIVLSVCSLPGVDLGTVPAWISAFGTGGTFVAAGIAALSYRRARESELEDQASQARLVMRAEMMTISERDPEGHHRWWVVFKNRSSRPIYFLQVHALRAQVQDDGLAVPMACVSKTKLGNTSIWAGGLPFSVELGPGEALETYWASNELAKCPAGVRAYQISFFDSNGRAWEIIDGCEPRKIRRPRPPTDLTKAS